jgi:hypothetical protein
VVVWCEVHGVQWNWVGEDMREVILNILDGLVRDCIVIVVISACAGTVIAKAYPKIWDRDGDE